MIVHVSEHRRRVLLDSGQALRVLMAEENTQLASWAGRVGVYE
jgi:hypothetical protein